jgi:hypothetical protein
MIILLIVNKHCLVFVHHHLLKCANVMLEWAFTAAVYLGGPTFSSAQELVVITWFLWFMTVFPGYCWGITVLYTSSFDIIAVNHEAVLLIHSKYVFSDSRDWQPSGKDRRTLLCSDCRAYCKRYGELPPVTAAGNNTRGDTPYLFRPVQTDSPDESPGRMRTRTRAKEQVRFQQACCFGYWHSILINLAMTGHRIQLGVWFLRFTHTNICSTQNHFLFNAALNLFSPVFHDYAPVKSVGHSPVFHDSVQIVVCIAFDY